MSTKKISDMSDRKLQENIFASQIVILQKLNRMNDFFLSKYGKDYIDEIKHKDETYERLERDLDDFWSQYRTLMSDRENQDEM